MEEIKEIISVVSRNKIRKIETISQDMSNTKLFQLYELIEEGVVNSDEEAIVALYKKVTDKSRSSYNKLKYSLKGRLLNTMFFIRSNLLVIEQDQAVAYVDSMKRVMEIRLLASGGAFQMAVKMAKNLLRKLERYEFWDLATFITRLLRRRYVIKSPSFAQFKKYDRKLNQYIQIESRTIEAEGLYYQLVVQIISNKFANLQLSEQARQYEKILSKQKSVIPSFKLDFYKNAITIIKQMSAYEYPKAIKTLEKAIDELKEPKFFSAFYTGYLVNLVACNIYLKQYEAGRSNLEKALKFTLKGSFNWVQTKSTHVTLALHAKEYGAIPAIYLEVTKNSKFKNIPSIFGEIWVLYFAWMYLLGCLGLMELPPRFISKQFNLEKWLENVEVVSKDKNLLSINVRIIRTINWLLDEDYGALIEREDSLKRYRYRYVRNSAQRRANLMLRYLINIQRREFIDYKCARINASVIKSLREMPMELKWANFEIEIVPFDDVVEIISGIMIKNSRRIRQPELPK